MRRLLPVLLVGLSALLAGAAEAPAGQGGTITGRVHITRGGEPFPDASGVVVYVVGFAEPPPPEPAVMLQKKRTFIPEVLAVTAGQRVIFDNLDLNLNHNVFSLDPRFNLGQYRPGRGRPPSHLFENPGAVEIYCNIHPEMGATVLVLPNRRFAATAGDGSFTIDGVPPGQWEVFAFDRHSIHPARAHASVAEGGIVALDFTLERDKTFAPHKTYEGLDYQSRHYLPPPPPERP